MILPTKHTNLSESLLGFGAYLLTRLDEPSPIDKLWKIYQQDYSNNIYNTEHSFDKFLHCLVFLHSIGILIEKDGEIVKCN